jgi:hypothetical protein
VRVRTVRAVDFGLRTAGPARRGNRQRLIRHSQALRLGWWWQTLHGDRENARANARARARVQCRRRSDPHGRRRLRP